jgi:vacuolar-type H+-ATPase subunit E/Vma4
MRDLLARRGWAEDYRIEPSIVSAGGLILATDDGRAVNNTIESRLDRADLSLRRLAAEMVPTLRRAES